MILALFSGDIQAATAPSTGKKKQNKALEKIEFQVLESQGVLKEKADVLSDNISVTAKLKITRVTETGSGLKVGQIIEVRYSRHTELGKPEGSWPRMLEVGAKYHGYMRAEEKHYVPVAASYSFILQKA